MLSASRANREYFRRAYHSGAHGWGAERPCHYTVAFLRRLRHLIPDGRLLDLGCGEGRHSVAAARLGFKVTAADSEPLALQRARRFAKLKGVQGISFCQADALRLPFQAASFDAVLDYGCLHHQRKSDWTAYMASLARVLRPGGFYALSVFAPKFHLFQGGRRPWHIAQGAYRRCFTPQDIRALFDKDFKILELIPESRGFWHALMRRRA